MKIEVIGRGNVGSRFAEIFGVIPVAPRTLEGLSEDADLYIISVSDSAVEEVAKRLPKVKGVVVHTTGSVPMDVLRDVDCAGYGVLYPLQTISKKRRLDAAAIPLMIEGDQETTASFLNETAQAYGFEKIAYADSEKRSRVHLAAAFACNFPNAMIAISQKILEESGIGKDIIYPLVSETFEKIRNLPAKDAQTGPAARKDYPTMEKHRSLLREAGMEEEERIYELISQYIMASKKD